MTATTGSEGETWRMRPSLAPAAISRRSSVRLPGVSPRVAHVVAERRDVDALGDLRLGDERAGTAPAHEIPLAHELVERGAHGEARDAEIDPELPLRRDRVADAERLDQLEHPLAGLALLRQRAARAGAAAASSRAPLSGSKKWKLAGSTARSSSAPTRALGPRVDPRGEERPVGGQQSLFRSRFQDLRRHRRRVDLEEDVRVRAELLEHLDARPDRRHARREGGVLEALGTDADDDVLERRRRRDRHEVLAEAHAVALDRARDEVHRRRADERGDEQVVRAAVENLRTVALQDAAVAHHRDALSERHRLRLVVGDVHGRDAEPLMQLRERRAHADAELRVEVRERLVEQERLRLADDRAAHRDALPLAARQLRRPPLEQIGRARAAPRPRATRRAISGFGVRRAFRP